MALLEETARLIEDVKPEARQEKDEITTTPQPKTEPAPWLR
ncbi:MAG: hypothetical protein ACLP9L_27315 [Thermoguttaceae bacterium]